MNADYVDDSDMTEITILPDGRIYAFGLSEAVKAVLIPLQVEAETQVANRHMPPIENSISGGGRE